MTLVDLLLRVAELDPDRRWLTFETTDARPRNWTYGEFCEEVRALACRLSEIGLKRGETFLVCLDNHPQIVRLILAASATGTVAVPVDPRLTERELTHCLDVCHARVAFARPDHLRLLAATSSRSVPIAAIGEPTEPATIPTPDADLSPWPADAERLPRDVVELLFTSGTTGPPKAVMLTNRSLVYGAEATAAGARYTTADVALIALPLYHAAAQNHQLWPTLLLGGRAVVVERFAPDRFFAQARVHGATTSAHFSTTLRLLLHRGSSEDARRSRIRHITFAQTLTATEFARWDEQFEIRLQQLWGMTETVGLPIMSPILGDRRLTAMGHPLAGYYEVTVRDGDGQVVVPDEPGEITVRADPGINVMLGYYGQSEATAELIRAGWLWTGDVARTDNEGFIHFVGRRPDLIRRGGQSFSANEIEAVIREVAGVVDVAVVGIPEQLGDEAVAAFVVGRGDRPTVDEIRRHCRSALAAFKRPQYVEFVPALPRTAVGKVQKHLLHPAQERVGSR